MILDVYPQVDGGMRYVWTCARGSLALDVLRDGTREVVRCLGYGPAAHEEYLRDRSALLRAYERVRARSDDFE